MHPASRRRRLAVKAVFTGQVMRSLSCVAVAVLTVLHLGAVTGPGLPHEAQVNTSAAWVGAASPWTAAAESISLPSVVEGPDDAPEKVGVALDVTAIASSGPSPYGGQQGHHGDVGPTTCGLAAGPDAVMTASTGGAPVALVVLAQRVRIASSQERSSKQAGCCPGRRCLAWLGVRRI